MNQGIDTSGGAQTITTTAQTLWSLMWANGVQSNSLAVDITSPQKTAYTTVTGTGIGINSAGGAFAAYRIGNVFNGTTSFDSLSFAMTTGTMTGKLLAFGYNE